MLSSIEEGAHTRGMTERMRELEAREDVLKELLAQEPADIPDIHPNVFVPASIGRRSRADGSVKHPPGSQ
jgi:hypothetical protein